MVLMERVSVGKWKGSQEPVYDEWEPWGHVMLLVPRDPSTPIGRVLVVIGDDECMTGSDDDGADAVLAAMHDSGMPADTLGVVGAVGRWDDLDTQAERMRRLVRAVAREALGDKAASERLAVAGVRRGISVVERMMVAGPNMARGWALVGGVPSSAAITVTAGEDGRAHFWEDVTYKAAPLVDAMLRNGDALLALSGVSHYDDKGLLGLKGIVRLHDEFACMASASIRARLAPLSVCWRSFREPTDFSEELAYALEGLASLGMWEG